MNKIQQLKQFGLNISHEIISEQWLSFEWHYRMRIVLYEINDTHKSHIKSDTIMNEETDSACRLRNNINGIDDSM